MQFHIQLIDDDQHPERRGQSRDGHWAYFDAHVENFHARGATRADDNTAFLSSVVFVEFPDWDSVREFAANEPNNLNGVYKEVIIRRWGNGLGRKQRDFPRKEGQINWYIRGYGKPNMHERRMELLDAHTAYFAAYDEENFIVRGGVWDDDHTEWQGSANLIALPSREAVMEFLEDEPFYKNGLYESVLIERYGFGGRPGQTV